MSQPSSIAQLFGLSEIPVGPGEKSSQVIKQEVYDSDLYDDTVRDSPILLDLVARGNDLLATFDHLTQDVFLSLFKLEPELLPDEDIADKFQVNKRLMEALHASENFERLRAMTQLDPISSALGTQVLAEKTIQQIESKQNKDRQETGETGQQPEGDRGNPTGTSQVPSQDLIEAITAASREAADEVGEVMKQAQAWGINPGDPSLRVNLQNKRKALERLRSSPRLRKFTDLIGRFRALARQIYKKKGSDGTSTISGVTVGSNLEHVLPSEKMMLGNKSTRLDFLRRYHQNELLQYRSRNQPSGRGPLVVCCDVSGSMEGKAEEWSKATMLALTEVAQKQRRDFASILFNSSIVGSWIIRRLIWDPIAIIDMAEVAPSGGTNFTAPLTQAMEIISHSRFRKADIVFITDGHCHVEEDFLRAFNQAKQRKGFIVFSVLINVSNSTSSRTVEQFSDDIITISSLAQLDDGAAIQVFNRITSQGI